MSNIYGTVYSDDLIGSRFDDYIYSADGNDSLSGGSGRDTLAGGKGNDTYFVSNLNSVLVEKQDQGIDTVITSISYVLGKNIENVTLVSDSNINAVGNSYRNRLIGNKGDNELDGKSNRDTMSGGMGNDIYYVDNSKDIIFEQYNEGFDTVYSTVTYKISANVENLELQGRKHINATGNDLDNYLTGNIGKNKIYGGLGNDTIDGGLGQDTLYGGKGNDTYYVDNAKDKIIESPNEGIDTVNSSVSHKLGANLENLVLIDSSSSTTLIQNGKQVVSYGESFLWKNYLDYSQGDNYQGYLGNCGIVSCENILIQAGTLSKKISYKPKYGVIDNQESQIVQVAIDNNLCTTYGAPEEKGGTYPSWQAQLLEKYGIDSHVEISTLEEAADYIKQDRGVILEVNAYKLWGLSGEDSINHAVTLTGVAYNFSDPSKIEGFYICDSGRGAYSDANRYISYNSLKSAFYYYNPSGYYGSSAGYMVVTDNAIKQSINIINGTGNELDNLLVGSNGSNLLDGQGGNDTINGGNGSDTLLGGFGNDVYEFESNDYLDYISDAGGENDIITLKADISKNTVALFKDNDNLIINYGLNSITVQNQFSENTSIEFIHIEETSQYLSKENINELIQQMSAFAQTNDVQLANILDVKNNNDLMTMIANSWSA